MGIGDWDGTYSAAQALARCIASRYVDGTGIGPGRGRVPEPEERARRPRWVPMIPFPSGGGALPACWLRCTPALYNTRGRPARRQEAGRAAPLQRAAVRAKDSWRVTCPLQPSSNWAGPVAGGGCMAGGIAPSPPLLLARMAGERILGSDLRTAPREGPTLRGLANWIPSLNNYFLSLVYQETDIPAG